MSPDISSFINKLQKSKLIAECPNCQREFQLSEAILFDGTKPFPSKAEKKKSEMVDGLDELNQEIKERENELKNSLINAPKRSERSTISSNLGTIMQNFLPHNKEFNRHISIADSRFLSAQIDIIVFDGASNYDVKHISFMDAKTGAGTLEPNQKQISDIVTNGKVRSELF